MNRMAEIRRGLAALDSDIVREAEYARRLPRESAPTRVHVSKVGGGTPGRTYDGMWEYAVIQRHVIGWTVIASGTDVHTGTPKTHAQVADMIADEYGDGFAEVMRDECCVARYGDGTACIRGEDGVTSYCGASIKRPAEFDTSKPGHVTQHCPECNTAYRASNWGRCPITH